MLLSQCMLDYTVMQEFNYHWRGFQNPDSSVSSVIPTSWGERASYHQNLAPTFHGIYSCLIVPKRDFLKIEASLWLNESYQNVAKGWLSTYVVVGKQPSIPLINLGRKWTLGRWWWWCIDSRVANFQAVPGSFQESFRKLGKFSTAKFPESFLKNLEIQKERN